MQIQVNDKLVNTVTGMIALVIRLEPGKTWYSETLSTSIGYIETNRLVKYWRHI